MRTDLEILNIKKHIIIIVFALIFVVFSIIIFNNVSVKRSEKSIIPSIILNKTCFEIYNLNNIDSLNYSIIFFIPIGACESCVDNIKNELKKFSLEEMKSLCILIPNNYDIRALTFFKKQYNANFYLHKDKNIYKNAKNGVIYLKNRKMLSNFIIIKEREFPYNDILFSFQ